MQELCRKAKVKLLTIQLILREGISYNRSQDSIEYLAGLSFNKNKRKDFYFLLTPKLAVISEKQRKYFKQEQSFNFYLTCYPPPRPPSLLR